MYTNNGMVMKRKTSVEYVKVLNPLNYMDLHGSPWIYATLALTNTRVLHLFMDFFPLFTRVA